MYIHTYVHIFIFTLIWGTIQINSTEIKSDPLFRGKPPKKNTKTKFSHCETIQNCKTPVAIGIKKKQRRWNFPAVGTIGRADVGLVDTNDFFQKKDLGTYIRGVVFSASRSPISTGCCITKRLCSGDPKTSDPKSRDVGILATNSCNAELKQARSGTIRRWRRLKD